MEDRDGIRDESASLEGRVRVDGYRAGMKFVGQTQADWFSRTVSEPAIWICHAVVVGPGGRSVTPDNDVVRDRHGRLPGSPSGVNPLPNWLPQGR